MRAESGDAPNMQKDLDFVPGLFAIFRDGE
jgi:hypothetical protein